MTAGIVYKGRVNGSVRESFEARRVAIVGAYGAKRHEWRSAADQRDARLKEVRAEGRRVIAAW